MRLVALSLVLVTQVGFAQEKAAPAKVDVLKVEGYTEPPQIIKDAVLAPWYKNSTVSNLSPDRKRYFVIERDGAPSLAMLAKPYENLAGLQIDHVANRRRATNLQNQRRLSIRNLADDARVTYSAAADETISDADWSPDGSTIALLKHTPKQSRLVLVDPGTGKEIRSYGPVTNVGGDAYQWSGDGHLVALMVPEKRVVPARPEVPASPRVRVSDDKPTRLRTLAGLLDSPVDADRLEAFMTSQLTVIDPKAGMKAIGKPSTLTAVSASHDAKYFIVTLLDRPYSYLLGWSSFPQRQLLWNDQGEQVIEISKRGPQTGDEPGAGGPGGRATGGGADGRRGLTWRFDGAGLTYLQLAPRVKDAPADAKRQDRVMLWSPPFKEADQKVVYASDASLSNPRFSEDGTRLFVNASEGGKSKLIAVKLADPTKPAVLQESAAPAAPTGGRGGGPAAAAAADADDLNTPGTLATRAGKKGDTVVRVSADGKYVYFTGTTYSKNPEAEAPKPYIDRVEIETGKKERVFESKADKFETASFVDDDFSQVLVNRQSPTEINQTFLVTTANKSERQLTKNEDFLPDLTQARREKIQVTRADGVKFWVTVTLPRFTGANAKLPAYFWFYPNEYVDQRAYDRTKRTENKNLFPTMGAQSKAIFLRLGYALVEPDCPIFGAATRVNDSYVPQLRNNLSATIDALDRLGYIDRSRLAIGGHSYGAFSTANAMIHTPFFKAGLAGSGNYNRSLTPFGFQSEQRTLWEGREMYMEMSPLLHLEDLTGALLLTHGMDDQNMGTAPINSERLFQALEALGKPASLTMYPYEDHGQSARETVLDMWARWVAWLEKYLKA